MGSGPAIKVTISVAPDGYFTGSASGFPSGFSEPAGAGPFSSSFASTFAGEVGGAILPRRAMMAIAATTTAMMTPIRMYPVSPEKPRNPVGEDLEVMVIVAFVHLVTVPREADNVKVTVPVLDPAVKVVVDPMAELRFPRPLGESVHV